MPCCHASSHRRYATSARLSWRFRSPLSQHVPAAIATTATPYISLHWSFTASYAAPPGLAITPLRQASPSGCHVTPSATPPYYVTSSVRLASLPPAAEGPATTYTPALPLAAAHWPRQAGCRRPPASGAFALKLPADRYAASVRLVDARQLPPAGCPPDQRYVASHTSVCRWFRQPAHPPANQLLAATPSFRLPPLAPLYVSW